MLGSRDRVPGLIHGFPKMMSTYCRVRMGSVLESPKFGKLRYFVDELYAGHRWGLGLGLR